LPDDLLISDEIVSLVASFGAFTLLYSAFCSFSRGEPNGFPIRKFPGLSASKALVVLIAELL
jgi:hypothetical protein